MVRGTLFLKRLKVWVFGFILVLPCLFGLESEGVGIRFLFPSNVELFVFVIRGDFGYWTSLCYTPRVFCCKCGRCGGFLVENKKKKHGDTLLCVFCITTFMAFYIVLFCQGRLLIAMGRMAFILNPKIALAHLPLSAVLRSRRRSPSSQKLVALSRRTRRQEQF